MVVGTCRIILRLPENFSLKGKRQVLRSVLTRVRNEYSVAAAEVADQDNWQQATLGLAYVSNEGGHAHEVLAKAVAFVERAAPDAELLDFEIEILYPF
ncbi:MAG: DUF503 domain-containing protein [Chloroflexota bacterium]